MEADGAWSDMEREDESVIELLRDRFRLLTISIAEAQGYFLNPIWLLRKLGKLIPIKITKYSDYWIDRYTHILNDQEERFLDYLILCLNCLVCSANRNDLEISPPIAACIADLAFKYTEQLAKDLELFAQHASRKSINMEDVIISAHRNEHLATSLRSYCTDLKSKEAQSERKRKKSSRKEDKATTSVGHIPDN